MARLARVIAPGMPHHVTQRGNPRQETFFGEEDVGPRHLPGDERPRARDPHPDRHWGLRPAVLQVAAPRAGRRAPPPSHESLEPVRIRSEEPNYGYRRENTGHRPRGSRGP